MTIEKQLQDTDFSRFSKVKDNLKEHLFEIRSQKQELTWDELDNLAAAGGPIPHKPLNQ
ncbi:MAG: hypothetical protein K6F95_08845 [Selenomonas sp.]|uniref:hypothetical protein n=1 Tax=Selenomonas sp. TaxID=2053611 RepID=UPI0025F79026|nr:hypothetical protein [Selenomonas sp.]MCR5757998.1 hypothetical protein [Selenomonas sp.]